jgi:hypothetical protein
MAAGTYGEPGKNSFTTKGVSGILSPVVNAQTGVTQIYRQGAANTFQSMGTYNPSTKKFTPAAGLSVTDAKTLSSENSLKDIRGSAEITAKKSQIEAGVPAEAAEARSKELINTGKATTSPSGENTGPAQKEGEKDLGSQNSKTREKFSQTLKYPSTLKSEHQDVIKFKMVKYRPRKLSTGGDLNPVQDRTAQDIIGIVTLPIPSGISDATVANWNSDEFTPLQALGADIANTAITQGFKEGADVAGKGAESAASNSGDLKTLIANSFVQAATGTQNLLSRTKGAVVNPNMELLFLGPQLRPFNFTFKLSARSQREAQEIRSIIRFFKQGMSPIRTPANLFLKAPHTFQIEYLHRNKPHSYLNKFKECALQSFTVDYTPEGQYSTFTDGAMVSYQISMQFQELEPIFNDDYTSIDQNNDTYIGY